MQAGIERLTETDVWFEELKERMWAKHRAESIRLVPTDQDCDPA